MIYRHWKVQRNGNPNVGQLVCDSMYTELYGLVFALRQRTGELIGDFLSSGYVVLGAPVGPQPEYVRYSTSEPR